MKSANHPRKCRNRHPKECNWYAKNSFCKFDSNCQNDILKWNEVGSAVEHIKNLKAEGDFHKILKIDIKHEGQEMKKIIENLKVEIKQIKDLKMIWKISSLSGKFRV